MSRIGCRMGPFQIATDNLQRGEDLGDRRLGVAVVGRRGAVLQVVEILALDQVQGHFVALASGTRSMGHIRP